MALNQQQLTQQQEFQPQITPEQTRALVSSYRSRAHVTSDENLENLRQHAQYYNIPFYEGEFSIVEAVKQAGAGFIEGFTTLKVADHPDNEYEAILRNIGHLAGFAPGMIAGPAKFLKLGGLANAARLMADKSIPMWGAKIITKKAKSVASGVLKASRDSRFKAMDTASNFLLGNRAKHIMEGAFHLGTATAISSWQGGVDEMMHSAFGGAIAGGVFRGIGNIIPGSKKADKFARGLAGSLFMGIPSTARGATTPEQIYEYLMGAYFGGKEGPWFRAKAGEFVNKMDVEARKNPKLAVERNPEDMEGFSELPELVQKHAKEIAEGIYKKPAYRRAMAAALMEKRGITDQIPAEGNIEDGYPILQKVIEGKRSSSGVAPSDLMDFGVSGGAAKADKTWAKYLEKAGVPVVHYIPKGTEHELVQRKIPGVPRAMSTKESLDNIHMVEDAALKLGKTVPSKEKTLAFILRNAEIVKKSSKIYAVGSILSPDLKTPFSKRNPNLHGKALEGGTGWTVQMAMDARKPIFVFDQPSRKWFTFDYGVRGGGKFKSMKGIPDLVKRPGVIGSSKFLSPTGAKAIRDVVAKKFPEAFKGHKMETESKTGVDVKKVEMHKETAKQYYEIYNKRVELEDRIKVYEEMLKDKSIPKGQITKARKELKEFKKQYKETDKQLAKLKKLTSSQFIAEDDIIIDESDTAVDIGTRPSDAGKKSVYFVKNFMKELWEKKTGDLPVTKNARINLLAKNLQGVFKKHHDPDFKVNHADDFIEEIGKIWAIDVPTEARGYIRRWLKTSNKGIITRHLRVDLATNRMRLAHKNAPLTYAGKNKKIRRAPTVLELFYENNRPAGDKGPAIVLLDEVTAIKELTGTPFDIPLYNLKKYWEMEKVGPKRTKRGKEKAETKFRGFQEKVINTMYDKYQMVPIGGVGDKPRMMFVKVHPGARKSSSKIKLDVASVRNVINKFTYKDKNGKTQKLDKLVVKKYNADKEKYEKLFGKKAGKNFDRIYLSNVLYDMSLNGFKIPTNKAEFRKTFEKLLNPEKFVGNAVAYNKRAQIWFNPFYGGDKEFMKSFKTDKGENLGLTENGDFRYVLIKDPKKPGNKTSLKALNIELPEHIDGAIIVRNDVIDAVLEDAGLPKSGQNKSFIVSQHPELGALLGKYMMHTGGKTATEQMKKQGIHFMIMTSAAKQTGNRKATNYKVDKKGNLTFEKGSEVHELNPEDIYYSESVYGKKKMAKNQAWVKQLFTNFQRYGYSAISKEVLDDIGKTIIQDSAEGTKEGNALLEKYESTLDDSYISDVINNLDKVGTQKLLDVAKIPGAERFAEALLQKMLRVNIEAAQSAASEGEVSEREAREFIDEVQDFNSVADRILDISGKVSREANSKGKTGFSAYFHKFVRDYRLRTMHNWVVNKVTKPKVDNSGMAFIRPYDKFTARRLPDLNKRDDIFYLDGAYKDTRIELAHVINKKSNMSLGELWDTYQKKVNKDVWKKGNKIRDYVEDLFEAVVLRVPMDSASGAHKLKFKGFTNREGHGILMHSRSMRALGGADLDGDEAFFYFGGRTEDGKGSGMKKSWKDAIHAQKEEYYFGKGAKRDVADSKTAIINTGPDKGKTFSEVLTISGGEDLKKSKTLFYSPMARLNASEGAVEGRNMLRTAVNNGQILKSTYNAIMDGKTKKDVFEIEMGFGKKRGIYKITIKPKETEAWRRLQREMTRAQIAFSSDPLDEAGLKTDVFFRKLYDAYFYISAEKKYGKKWFKASSIDILNIPDFALKGGIYGKLAGMNSANFGRNWSQGRNWTFDEQLKMNQEVFNLEADQVNSMLPKMAEVLSGIDYTEDIFTRLDLGKLKEFYGKIEKYRLTLDDKFSYVDKKGEYGKPGEKRNWLLDAMKRSTFKVKYNDEIDVVIDNKLYDYTVREAYARSKDITRFKALLEKLTIGKLLKLDKNKARLFNPEERLEILNQVVKNAEDFILNDISDMTSILKVVELVDKYNISPEKMSELHAKSSFFKQQTYMDRKRRRQATFVEIPETEVEKRDAEQFKVIQEMLEKIAAIRPELKKKMELGDEPSALMDQFELDVKINEYKFGTKDAKGKVLTKGLSNEEQQVFDHLMLGSLDRGILSTVKKYYEMIPENMRDPLTRDIRKFYKGVINARTQLHRVGFNSSAISDASIKDHLSTMSDVFGKVWRKPSEKETSELVDGVDKALETTEIEMADGKKEEGYVGTDYVIDEMVEKAADNTGFAGIKAGEISKEDKAVITELATNLKSMNDKIGSQLNEVLGGITKELTGTPKDLNAFNRQDFIMVNEYLKDLKKGSIFQQLFREKNPKIRKRNYWQFPEAINKELMAYDIKWLKEEGFFLTKDSIVPRKGIIRKPTYYIDILMNGINRMGGLSISRAESLIRDNGEKFLFLDGLKEGTGLFQIAIAQREMNMKNTIFSTEDVKNPRQKSRQWNTYKNSLKEIEKKYDWEKLKDKKYIITNDEGKRIEVTGHEVVNGSDLKGFTGIKRRVNKQFGKFHSMIAGDKEWMYKKKYFKSGAFSTWDKEGTQPKANYKLFLKDVHELLRKGDEASILGLMEKVGIDGMRHIARSMMVDHIKPENRKKFQNFKIFDTGKIDYQAYWPHMFFSKSKAKKALAAAIKEINDDPHMTPEEKTDEINKIAYHTKALTGDWEFQDMQDWDRVDQLSYKESLKEISDKEVQKRQKIHWYEANQRMGSMMSRTSHIEGWSKDLSVMDAYMRNLSNTFFRQMQQIISRDVIEGAYWKMRPKFGEKLAGKWNTFFKLYAAGAMGNPEIIPKEVYDDKDMNIKGTPYAWWADNRVLDRVNSIADKLGIKKKDLPKELAKFGLRDIRDWSNMEAKFELASLLAHPKSSVTNIFGGSIHTIESVGFEAFRNARNIKFLKRINPDFNTLEDVKRWVIEKGVLPEFLIHELGIKSEFKGKNAKDFLSDIAKKFQSKDSATREDIRSVASEYGIADKVVNIAAKFMSIPETTLRRDAFMAHYIRAWERFGGAIRDPNHPFLIEMAKKGVKATQFLYDAPNRPLFARSALGKVMTRFQLFAWNAVRFRNAVTKEAKLRGFKGEAGERFARMMQIDLFVLALSNIFMYSLFDNALPPPWNWMQDTSDWLLGDEKERDKAFFGALPRRIAPLQTVMPPIARGPISAIQEWVRDDYSKFTDYQIWTMFPFGRMARDILHPKHGLIKNPSRIVEKTMGLPVHDLSRKIKEAREKE